MSRRQAFIREMNQPAEADSMTAETRVALRRGVYVDREGRPVQDGDNPIQEFKGMLRRLGGRTVRDDAEDFVVAEVAGLVTLALKGVMPEREKATDELAKLLGDDETAIAAAQGILDTLATLTNTRESRKSRWASNGSYFTKATNARGVLPSLADDSDDDEPTSKSKKVPWASNGAKPATKRGPAIGILTGR